MRKEKKNQKGIALIELLVVIAMVAFITPLLIYVFIDGTESFNTYSKYSNQHDKVIGVTMRIRNDIEEAEGYKLYNSFDHVPVSILALRYPVYEEGSRQPVRYMYRYWKLEGGKLSVMTNEGNSLNASGSYETVVDGLDTSVVYVEPPDGSPRTVMVSGFSEIPGRIILTVKPKKDNTVRQNRNVTEPVITEFFVDYKNRNIGEF